LRPHCKKSNRKQTILTEKCTSVDENEKDNKRNWHIFALTGRFSCYFTKQDLPVKQTLKPIFTSILQDEESEYISKKNITK
jgi:hypothetical protein